VSTVVAVFGLVLEPNTQNSGLLLLDLEAIRAMPEYQVVVELPAGLKKPVSTKSVAELLSASSMMLSLTVRVLVLTVVTVPLTTRLPVIVAVPTTLRVFVLSEVRLARPEEYIVAVLTLLMTLRLVRLARPEA